MRLAAPVAVLALLLSPLPLTATTPLPDWLAGTWQRESGSTWAEELWTAPRDGMMLGITRNGFGQTVNAWEYVRIERGREGAPVLVVQTEGKEPVRYPLAVASDAAIEFANPAQPFPQRIRYWREGQLLMLEVSRMDGSGAEQWNYRPVVTSVD